MIYIYPYNKNSESATLLSQAIGGRRIRRENSTFRGKPDRIVINWGCSEVSDEVAKCTIINKPEAVAVCADKLKFFKSLKDTSTVPFTEDKEEAIKWLGDGGTVLCRTILNGHGGMGIRQVEKVEDLVNCKLYTKYVPKRDEWRVHLFRGEPFLFQRKALDKNRVVGDVNWKIRNLNNGFIFAKNEGIDPPKDVVDQAINAFNSIKGLDFGSVDVIWNALKEKAFVLEINTASGISGTTVDAYAEKFKIFA